MEIEEIKFKIESFVYFLFSGNYCQELIVVEKEYINFLVQQPEDLYICFKIFAFGNEHNYSDQKIEKLIANYIISKLEQKFVNIDFLENQAQFEFWSEFLKLSYQFCFNKFINPVNFNYLNNLKGVGGDAVSIFSVWLNNIKFSTEGKITNKEFSLKRANKRIKVWDGTEKIELFSEKELEQFIW